MDRKLGLLVVILILSLIAFYFSNPRKNMLGNLDSNKLSLNPTSSQTPSAASLAPNPSPQASQSPLPSPTTFPDGLIVQDEVVGNGPEVKAGDSVTMQYVGTLQNGQKFDSSYDRNQPFTTQIGVGSVIRGWDEGVPGMKVGGKRKLIIPSDLGYGNQAKGSIPPNSTLIFEVELLGVK